MATITSSSTLFTPELVKETFSKVKGHSSLAKLCAMSAIPFAGNDYFTFTMDGEAAIVGESGKKPAGTANFGKVTIKPIKFVYQHRITDEFIKLTEEKQIPYLETFTDGFSKKMARALDIAALHGVNPATGTASTDIIGTNYFDSVVSQTVVYNASSPDDNIDAAATLIQASDGTITGIAMSPAFGSALGSMKTGSEHVSMYPEFRFGGNPAAFGGVPSDVNGTVSFGANLDRAIIGDFSNAFKWGYSEDIPIEIIQYGDPDNTGIDLKGSNQICLRAEAYIGWGILDPTSFARIVASAG